MSELTGDETLRLSDAGLDEVFPYSVLIPARGTVGIGLWSRFPIDPASPPIQSHIAIVAGRIQIPGVLYDPVVVSLHITSPVTAEPGSFADGEAKPPLQEKLNHSANIAGPAAVIVAGDFNSTPDMRQFRDC